MTAMLHISACLFLRAVRAKQSANSINNSAASAQLFIPSGGRVGAARLNRHIALNRG